MRFCTSDTICYDVFDNLLFLLFMSLSAFETIPYNLGWKEANKTAILIPFKRDVSKPEINSCWYGSDRLG